MVAANGDHLKNGGLGVKNTEAAAIFPIEPR
jgi:hypothetical protein